MEHEGILLSRVDGIATLTLDRPPGNTLSSTMLPGLSTIFSEIESDHAVRAVIITGTGDHFFCAGADIRELRAIEADDFAERGQMLFRSIETLSKPVIAALNGSALGGGCELALSCHLRIAADTARFGQPEIAFGLMPCWGATQRLPRLIGPARALEMLLTGQTINAHRAEQIGLVNSIVPASELKEAALKLAHHFAHAAPLALKSILAFVDTGQQEGLTKGLDSERDNFDWVYRTEDARAASRPFSPKRDLSSEASRFYQSRVSGQKWNIALLLFFWQSASKSGKHFVN